MRSLFIKIFLSFLLITLLASVTTAAISYWAQIGPYAQLKNRLEQHQYQSVLHAMEVTGIAAVKILETGGEQELVSYLIEIEQDADDHIFIVKADGRTFSGRELPSGATDLVESVHRSADVQYNIEEAVIIVAKPFEVPGWKEAVMIGTIPRITWPPSFPQGIQNRKQFSGFSFHFPLGLPLLIMMLVAATGCYLLARSLTAPVRYLRAAVQQMAKGDFSVRVSLPLGRKDEITDLSRDFNTMIERIASLIEAQKRLLRDISHELRSPLTRMNVSLELVRRQPENAESYLLRIEKESDRLNDLIGQLLTLTRLEGKVDNKEKEQLNVSELVEEIAGDANFEAAGLDRRVQLGTLDNAMVLGSREMLGRALENVIRNGLHYTAAGTAVDVEVVQDEGHVAIRIRDHGVGVPEDKLEQIFKPFYRVAESRNRDSGGNGIGLAIAKQAVLMHGGSIEARNHTDGGLVVELRLPLQNGT